MEELRTNLKDWEARFVKEHSRKPKKEDIDAAPSDIKDTYFQYTKLKREKQGDSIKKKNSDADNKRKDEGDNKEHRASNKMAEVEVWGKQFDKKAMDSDSKEQKTEFKNTMSCNTFLQKMSSKLFENDKKLENKAASWRMQSKLGAGSSRRKEHKTKSSDSSSDNIGHSPNAPDVKWHEDETDIDCKISKFGILSNASSIFSPKPKKLVQTEDDVPVFGKYKTTVKSRGTIPLVQGLKPYTPQDSADVADVPSVTRKLKNPEDMELTVNETENVSFKQMISVEKEVCKIDSKEQKRTPDNKNTKKQSSRTYNSSVSNSSDLQFVSSKDTSLRTEELQGKDLDTCEPKMVKTSKEMPTNQFDFMEEECIVPVVPRQKRRRQADKGEVVSKAKRQKKEESLKESEAIPEESMAEPEDESGKCTLKPKSLSISKKSVASNDNFVRLNMKVKSYRRKGKGMTGGQMKRFQWKQKMKARSASYGDKCFKCGQEGHWANKCKAKGSSAFGKTENQTETVLEEDFPSLSEAAMMARGVKMAPKDKQTPKETDLNGAGDMDEDEEDAEEVQIEANIVRSAPDELPPPPPMSPLHTLEGPYTDVPDYVMEGLRKFGYSQFRKGQQKAIMRILAGLSTLVVLSTGGGKSLCYQLSAYLYAQRSKSVTLVVSPLVSLMEDQITGLPPGVRGACLHTNMTPAQREGVLSAVKEGKIHFLLVSPEAVAGGSMTLLNAKASLPPISFVCIDEAHCLSEWSHNFRPSYLRLCKVLREKFGVQCFLGLTATATQSTATDVAKHLGITDLEEAVIRGVPVPPNLNLSVSRDEDREGALLGLLQGKRFSECESIIIYCTRRQETDRIATLIRTCLKEEKNEEWSTEAAKKKGGRKKYGFWDAESYHAGLTPAQRKRVQNAFMSGRLRVVVATVAFGMGLDKADVRGIVHFNMPKSFESYVQEIGRAGRDGQPSHCHVFLDSEGRDLSELRRHTHANTVDYRTLKRFVQKVFIPCHCKAVHQLHQQSLQDTKKENSEEHAEQGPWDEKLGTSEIGEDQDPERACKEKICPGHERALCVESTVMDLDVKEEGLSTLLCYLEIHSDFGVENLSNVYSTCKIQCYGGPAQLQSVAKKCPPVAVAIAKAKKDGKSFANSNEISFPVVEISDCMGWNSGLVKRELKVLAWNLTGTSGPRKTGVMVEFSDLAFHFRSPGDLDDNQTDDVLQFLHNRVQQQEKSELQQLKYLSQTLHSVSHKNYWMCADELDEKRNQKLKSDLRDYFQHQKRVLESAELPPEQISPQDLQQAISDIHQFVGLYGHEHRLNGRVIARIFHGISSPCFPASTWGRVRRFWRNHMHVDFNELSKIATREIIKMR